MIPIISNNKAASVNHLEPEDEVGQCPERNGRYIPSNDEYLLHEYNPPMLPSFDKAYRGLLAPVSGHRGE